MPLSVCTVNGAYGEECSRSVSRMRETPWRLSMYISSGIQVCLSRCHSLARILQDSFIQLAKMALSAGGRRELIKELGCSLMYANEDCAWGSSKPSFTSALTTAASFNEEGSTSSWITQSYAALMSRNSTAQLLFIALACAMS
eukprot:2712483-Amphidinium_carterae.1